MVLDNKVLPLKHNIKTPNPTPCNHLFLLACSMCNNIHATTVINSINDNVVVAGEFGNLHVYFWCAYLYIYIYVHVYTMLLIAGLKALFVTSKQGQSKKRAHMWMLVVGKIKYECSNISNWCALRSHSQKHGMCFGSKTENIQHTHTHAHWKIQNYDRSFAESSKNPDWSYDESAGTVSTNIRMWIYICRPYYFYESVPWNA